MSARPLPILDDNDALRPRTFGDCLRDGWGDDGTPCPWVSCAHHLAWARATSGTISADADERGRGGRAPILEIGDERSTERLALLLDDDSDDAPWLLEDMLATCALRVAQEPQELRAIGAMFGVSHERVRQIESKALKSLDSYRTRPVLSTLLDGREVSRPDLVPEGAATGQGSILKQLRKIAPVERSGSGWVATRTPAFASAPPVRVLTGEERAQRIAELKARSGAAPVIESKESKPEETVVMPAAADKESGARAFAALVKYAERRGIARTAAQRELNLSSSTVVRLKKTGCLPSLADRLEAALAALLAGAATSAPALAAASRRAPAPKPAARSAAPSSSTTLTLDQIPRVVAVIERLGGIERAERIAAAIGGAL